MQETDIGKFAMGNELEKHAITNEAIPRGVEQVLDEANAYQIELGGEEAFSEKFGGALSVGISRERTFNLHHKIDIDEANVAYNISRQGDEVQLYKRVTDKSQGTTKSLTVDSEVNPENEAVKSSLRLYVETPDGRIHEYADVDQSLAGPIAGYIINHFEGLIADAQRPELDVDATVREILSA